MREFHIVFTVLVAILFVGIVIWAWSGRQKKSFDEASRLPLDDDHELIPPSADHTESK